MRAGELEVQRGTRKKHRSRPWLKAEIDGSQFTIGEFHSLANCKAHVVKHVLGLMYEDELWDKESWDQLLHNTDVDRGELVQRLSGLGCKAVEDRDQARQPNSGFSFDRTCIECGREDPNRCNGVLWPLLMSYQEAIRRSLWYSQNLPRFTRHVEIRPDRGQVEGMYHLDSMGVFVTSRSVALAEPQKLRVITCYRPVPPQDAKWCEGCLDYAKKRKCLKMHLMGRIRVRVLSNEATWGFRIKGEEDRRDTLARRQPAEPYKSKGHRPWSAFSTDASRSDRAKSAPQALRQSLAEAEEMRRSQVSEPCSRGDATQSSE